MPIRASIGHPKRDTSDMKGGIVGGASNRLHRLHPDDRQTNQYRAQCSRQQTSTTHGCAKAMRWANPFRHMRLCPSEVPSHLLSYRLRYAFSLQYLTRQGYFRMQDAPQRFVQPRPGRRSVSRANQSLRLASLDMGSKLCSHQGGSTFASLLRGIVR